MLFNTISGPMAQRIGQLYHRFRQRQLAPEEAYDLWAGTYDDQPLNLMFAWDEDILRKLLSGVEQNDKHIADIGCGTGRYWPLFMKAPTAKITGFDISEKMIDRLKEKFPLAETHVLREEWSTGRNAEEFDIVTSTLTIAHIQKPEPAIAEWSRILKPGGSMIITDFHPEALKKGGRRTFEHAGSTWAVRNYVHPIPYLIRTAATYGLADTHLIERRIDESAKPYYDCQNRLDLYRRWKGEPIIYGLLLTKKNVADKR